jgi:hypothetical protein
MKLEIITLTVNISDFQPAAPFIPFLILSTILYSHLSKIKISALPPAAR